MYRFRRFINSQLSNCLIYAIIIFLALSLLATIGLLIWQLLTPVYFDRTNSTFCPPNPCPTTTMGTSVSSTQIVTPMSNTSSNIFQTSVSITASSTSQSITGRKRTYKEICDYLSDCYTEYGLLCEYGWNTSKSCLCEGSHYWSTQQNKCVRKGETNDSCDVDYQCHREIGFVCDQPPGASTKICICAASIYWAKNSNCGQTTFRRIVDCINENYATICLVLDTNNIYHMVTIRSVTEKELSFDWFLIDNRNLTDLPQLSCTFNNDTKYCFGLSVQDSQHALRLAQFTRKGFHSIEDIGGSNRGTAFGLTNINNVSVYVRNSQNTLYRRLIVDDEILAANDIALSLSGDPTCYIHELITTRQIYCFARNAAYSLTEYAELSAYTWRVTQLSNTTDRIRNETAPVCSYVGQIRRYCFAVFENGQIYRILHNSTIWSAWQSIGTRQQFITQPVFLTSKLLNQSTADQTCYLLAIDINNTLQLSTNPNCASSDNFSEWIPISTILKFKQFDKSFRLRDNHVGILGIDSQDRAYYTYLDPETNQFISPRLAITVKPEQFRP